MGTCCYLDKESNVFVSVGRHTLSDEVMPYYILKGQLSKKTAAYYAIGVELNQCYQSIDFLKNILNNPEVPEIAKKSLWYTAVVQYAKCFNSSEGRGTSLDAKHIYKTCSPEIKDFHDATMDLRNKYLAHAGEGGFESSVMVAYLSPFGEQKIEAVLYNTFRLKDDKENLDNYLALMY